MTVAVKLGPPPPGPPPANSSRSRPRPPPEFDALTLRRAQRGDDRARRDLVERYQRPVFALLSRMLHGRGRELVEDLAQDTFLRVFRALPGFDPEGPARLSSWILTIASRRAIDELRRQRRPMTPIEEETTLAANDRSDHLTRRRMLAQQLQAAIADLSPEHRAAFLLREYHELSYEEIAAELELDLGTVKSRLSRARAALRHRLAEVYHGS